MRGGDNLLISCWFQGRGLLDKAVEQFALAARSAPVEAEGKFVQIILQMLCPDRSLMRSQQPALYERDNLVNTRQPFPARPDHGPS